MSSGIAAESDKHEIDAKCLKYVSRAQADGLRFHTLVEALRVIAATVGMEARWTESCQCHEYIWTKNSSWHTKQRLLFNSIGCSTCAWKGKRATEMASGRLRIFLTNIRDCSSPRLKELLARASGEDRTAALDMLHRLKSRLTESLTAKLKFWNHIPWSFCAVWTHSWKADAVAGKVLMLTECRRDRLRLSMHEYDRLVAAGHSSDIPRTAHRLFGAGDIRAAMDCIISVCEMSNAGIRPKPKLWDQLTCSSNITV
jgi:hypothetical protein